METNEMDRDQKSLLLYIETRCVDHYGVLDDRHMNDVDDQNLSVWAKSEFIATRYRHDGRERGHNRVVRLSSAAWELAGQLRQERAARAPAEIWGEEK